MLITATTTVTTTTTTTIKNERKMFLRYLRILVLCDISKGQQATFNMTNTFGALAYSVKGRGRDEVIN